MPWICNFISVRSCETADRAMKRHWSCYLLPLVHILVCNLQVFSTCPPMCDTPQHDRLQYSSSSLKAVEISMSPCDLRLPKDVYQLTLDLGIGIRHHVHRGSRDGKQKGRNLAKSANNLISKPSTPPEKREAGVALAYCTNRGWPRRLLHHLTTRRLRSLCLNLLSWTLSSTINTCGSLFCTDHLLHRRIESHSAHSSGNLQKFLTDRYCSLEYPLF